MNNQVSTSVYRRILPFIVFSVLEGFVLVYPVYMIMLSSWGFGYGQISIILTIWSLPVILLEIPSSVLADRWSKRNLVALGMALKALGFALWLLKPDLVGVCAGFVLWGCQEALCSGTRQALLYDRLARDGDEGRYEEVAGVCGAAMSWSIVAAMILGGLVYAVSPAVVILCSIAASLAGAFVALRFADARAGRDARMLEGDATEAPRERMLESLRRSIRRPGIVPVILVFCVVGGVFGLVEEYDGLWYVDRYGLPAAWVGFWCSLRFGAEGVGGLLAGPVKRLIGGSGHIGLAACVALAGGSFTVSVMVPGLAGAPAYLASFVLASTLSVILEGRIQACASSDNRATLLSTANLLMTAFAALLSPALGLIAEKRAGLPTAFAAAGILAAAASAIALAAGRREGA